MLANIGKLSRPEKILGLKAKNVAGASGDETREHRCSDDTGVLLAVDTVGAGYGEKVIGVQAVRPAGTGMKYNSD